MDRADEQDDFTAHLNALYGQTSPTLTAAQTDALEAERRIAAHHAQYDRGALAWQAWWEARRGLRVKPSPDPDTPTASPSDPA